MNQEPHRIKCAEIWGGILSIDMDITTEGLSASIFSTAHDGNCGGDMYYVSVCKWDYLTRMAVADLRGHGCVCPACARRLAAFESSCRVRPRQSPFGSPAQGELRYG